MPKHHVTSVRLDEFQHSALARFAEKQDRSVSWLVNTAINLYLREHGYSRLDHQPAPPAAHRAPAPAAPVAAPAPVREPVREIAPVLEQEALIETPVESKPVRKSAPKAPPKKKPNGGWTPERRRKQENLRRKRMGLAPLPVE